MPTLNLKTTKPYQQPCGYLCSASPAKLATMKVCCSQQRMLRIQYSKEMMLHLAQCFVFLLLASVFSLSDDHLYEHYHTVCSMDTAQMGTHCTLLTTRSFSTFLMQVNAGEMTKKLNSKRQVKMYIICCQEKISFSLLHFYFLHCWSTKCSLKGYLQSMLRLCVTSDGSSCWMTYCDCANYLKLIITISCSKSVAIGRTCVRSPPKKNKQQSNKQKEPGEPQTVKYRAKFTPVHHLTWFCRTAWGNENSSSAHWRSVNRHFKDKETIWRILHLSASSA